MSYRYSRSFHFTVWTSDDWRSHAYDTLKNELIDIINKLPRVEKLRILLVDDAFKTGTSMGRVWSLVNEVVEELEITGTTEIKVAVIVYRSDQWDRSRGPEPDYYMYEDYTHFPYAEI